MSHPTVSVIMTVHNGESFIAESVCSVLRQSFADLELLVVDDGSTDRSSEILSSFDDSRLRVHRVERIGRTPALNLALDQSTGTLVAVLDADDVSAPERLQHQVARLEADDSLVLVASWCEFITHSGEPRGCFQPPGDHEALLQWFPHTNPIAHSSVVFRRSAAVAVGGYPHNYAYAQDLALWHRLLSQGRFAIVEIPLVKLRVHRERMTQAPNWRKLMLGDTLALLETGSRLPGVSADARRLGRNARADLLMGDADAKWLEGQYFSAVQTLVRAALLNPVIVARDRRMVVRVADTLLAIPIIGASTRWALRGLRELVRR